MKSGQRFSQIPIIISLKKPKTFWWHAIETEEKRRVMAIQYKNQFELQTRNMWPIDEKGNQKKRKKKKKLLAYVAKQSEINRCYSPKKKFPQGFY